MARCWSRGALGVLVEERHATGGVDPDAAGNQTLSSGPMVGSVAGFSLADGLLVTTRSIRPRTASFDDHRIDGTAVLPGVMGIEAFAEVAALMTPDLVVTAIEAVDFLAPVKFYRDEPRVVELSSRGRVSTATRSSSTARSSRGARSRAARSRRRCTSPAAQHWRASRRRRRPLPSRAAPMARSSMPDAIYGIFFHGPAYRVLDAEWRDAERAVGRLAPNLPANHEPADQPTRTAPRLVELCFQTAGVLELGTTGRMALPTHVDRVESSPGATDTGPRWAVVTPRPGDSKVDAVVVDDAGTVLVRVEGYEKVDTADSARRRRARAVAARRWAEWCHAPSRASPSSTAASAPCGSCTRSASSTTGDDEPLVVIALYTEPERHAMFVREADEAVCIGPATFVDDGRRKNGYLDFAALERALVDTRADAVWVGWGFVAEQPEFVERCEQLGIVFVGPRLVGDAAALGDKISAKRLAEECGVPVAPWSGGAVDDRRRGPAPCRPGSAFRS